MYNYYKYITCKLYIYNTDISNYFIIETVSFDSI